MGCGGVKNPSSLMIQKPILTYRKTALQNNSMIIRNC